jgi:hypothetical protein
MYRDVRDVIHDEQEGPQLRPDSDDEGQIEVNTNCSHQKVIEATAEAKGAVAGGGWMGFRWFGTAAPLDPISEEKEEGHDEEGEEKREEAKEPEDVIGGGDDGGGEEKADIGRDKNLFKI